MATNLKAKLTALVFVILLSAGCAAKAPIPPPNQLSTLDGQAWDVLYTAQAALQEAQKQFQAGTIPQSAMPVYTAAAVAYNNCEATWHTYRAALAGTQSGDLTAYEQALKDQMTILKESIAALKTIGGL